MRRQDGGFILTGGAGIEKGNPDNPRVKADAFMQHGVYS